MGMPCSVCASPHRHAVDADLVKGESARAIGLKFKLGERAIQRHRLAHLSPPIAAVQAERAEAGARPIVARLEAVLAKVECLVEQAEREGSSGVMLAAAREARSGIELLARLSGELDERPQVTVNVLASPEVQALMTTLLAALGPFPEARVAAAEALQTIDVEARA